MEAQEDLCMHNSKTIRRLAVIAGMLVMFLALETLATATFDTVHQANLYNYDMSIIEKEGKDVSLIAVGASQVYHGVNPDVVAQILGDGGEVIAASTASMSNDGAFYLLRNHLRRFHPKYVVVNLNWDRFITKDPVALDRGRLLVSDRLPRLEGIEYILSCAPVKQWLNISNMYRFGSLATSPGKLIENYQKRSKIARGDFSEIVGEDSYYKKNGYVCFKESVADGNIPVEHNQFSEDMVSSYELEYCRKIAELCDKQGVPMIFVSIPTTLAELYSIEGYQDCVDYMTRFCESLGHPYLNFSLIKDREELFPDSSFSDHIHLAESGAITFSKILSQTVLKVMDGEAVDDMFYESFEEMTKDVNRVVACKAASERKEDGTLFIEAESLKNDEDTVEYRLLTKEEGKVWTVLRDWQSKNTFSIDEHNAPSGMFLRLEARIRRAQGDNDLRGQHIAFQEFTAA